MLKSIGKVELGNTKFFPDQTVQLVALGSKFAWMAYLNLARKAFADIT